MPESLRSLGAATYVTVVGVGSLIGYAVIYTLCKQSAQAVVKNGLVTILIMHTLITSIGC